MADKAINELPAASVVQAIDLFVLEQNATAKKLAGSTLEQWLLSMADGHGGISSIAKIGSSGTNPVVDTYRITLADSSTFDFDVTNGVKGDTGDAMYLYIRYASQQPTSDSQMRTIPDAWMGIYTGLNNDPTSLHYTDYAWYQIKGATGNPGANASITSQTVEYQEHTSGTVIPTGAWSTTIPIVTQGNYLWTRTTITFNTGTPVVIYSVSHAGMDGTGTGDMRVAIYDPQNIIGNLPGGIPQYVSNMIPVYEIATPEMDSAEGSAGTANSIARGNHSHPKDTSKADLVGGKVEAKQATSRIIDVTASKTIALTDVGSTQNCINSSDITITIPAQDDVEFDDDTEIEFAIRGTGSVTFAGDTGVTVDSKDGALTASNQYSWVGLKRFDDDVWMLNGDLS